MTHQMHALRVQAVEEVQVIHGDVADIADPGRVVAVAEARMFRHHDLEFVRKLREERQPGRQAGGAVQVDERRARSVAQEAHANVAHLVPVFLYFHASPRSRLTSWRVASNRCRSRTVGSSPAIMTGGAITN